MASYRVFFYVGDQLGLKSRVEKGTAVLDPEGLRLNGRSTELLLPLANVVDVSLFRLHGLSRVIRIDTTSKPVFLAVVRFMIGQFASVNFFATGRLYKALRSQLGTP